MKTYKFLIVFLIAILGISSCTSDFEEINTDPNAVTVEDASARYFLTNVQYVLYAPNRFPYWRAHLIHADRYAGHFTFGFNGCWWSDELGYSYSASYTDASWDWLAGFLGSLDNFMRLTAADGEFPNELMFAVGQIIKGLYFQQYTDIFGELPYSQVGDPDILLPEYDTQKEIYQGIIAELDAAMATIGDNERTGAGLEDLGENDIYFNGDLQKWKKLANTLKLRIGMRALGAEGADFAQSAIQSALQAPLLETEEDNALMPKDTEISQWGAAAYGDVWHNFGGLGSKWNVSQPLVNYLRDYDDPRLTRYTQPAPGGQDIVLTRPNESEDPSGYELFPKRTAYILAGLDEAGVDYTMTESETGITISMPEEEYYVGQPVRLNGFTYPFARWEFYSKPADIVIQPKNEGAMYPEIIMTTAEAYFLRAEAALRGIGSGNAQQLFEDGIRHAMKIWDVADGEIDAYLADSELAQLDGTQEDNLRKIAIQRWLASYTDGFEAWAVVRDTGYPEVLANGVDDVDIFGLGDINGAYPQRMQYGNAAKDKNGENLQVALNRQGPDRQDVKLWYAK